MAEFADYIICFWDGEDKETKSIIEYAKIFRKPTRIKTTEKSSIQKV